MHDGFPVSPQRRSSVPPVLGVVLVAACGAVLVAAVRVDADWAWPNSLQLITSAGAVVVSFRLAVRWRAAPATWMAIGCVLWWCADLIALSFSAAEIIDTHHRIFETIYLSGQICWMVSALALVERPAELSALWRSVDATLFGFLAVFVLVSATEIAGVADMSYPWYGTLTLAVDSVLVAFAFLALRSVRGSYATAFALIALSGVALLGTDMTFVYGELIDSPAGPWIVDAGWSVSSVLRIAGLVTISHLMVRNRRPRHTQIQPTPLAASTMAGCVAASLALQPLDDWSPLRKALALVLVASIPLREYVAFTVVRRLAADRSKAIGDLERRAKRDDLTGLLRRDTIFDSLDEALEKSAETDSTVIVAYVDLDDFGAVNNNFGHAVGDHVLVAIAGRLVAIGADAVGRIGGDEFLVVARSEQGDSDMLALRDRVTSALDDPLTLPGDVVLRVGAGVGCAASRPGVDQTSDSIVAEADRDLQAQKSGKWGRSGAAAAGRGVIDVSELRRPISLFKQGRLAVWYQPVVDLASGRTVGAEALARLIDHDGTAIAAKDFVPILQAAGFGHDLSVEVLTSATNSFADESAVPPDWKVAINLSKADLEHPAMYDLLRERLHDCRIDPGRVILEIDEHLAPHHSILEAVSRLRSLGVVIALDDFGAGASTFAQISALRPSILKLDMGMIPTIGAQRPSGMQSLTLVNAIIQLAHQFDIQVLAEGIESDDQRTALLEVGCDLGQGFNWLPAVPLDELVPSARPADESPQNSWATRDRR